LTACHRFIEHTRKISSQLTQDLIAIDARSRRNRRKEAGVRVLITGGAGFIGSHIAETLVNKGHEVRIVDNLSTGNIQNLHGFADKVEFFRGDIRNQALLSKLATGCDLIYHQAAVVSVPYSVDYPQETHDVNIQGTLNVLLAARERGVKRVVFACSAAVYGEDPELPKRETMAAEPIAPYGIEKITGEYYCMVFNKLYGVEAVALRYFNVFGPRQDPRSPYSGVISIFVDRALSKKAADRVWRRRAEPRLCLHRQRRSGQHLGGHRQGRGRPLLQCRAWSENHAQRPARDARTHHRADDRG
jgi:nucleoside-diphosphate-sugar epimerase